MIKISRRDLRFMTVLYTIGSILTLCPRYDFTNRTLRNPMFTKIYAGVTFIALAAIGAFAFWEESFELQFPTTLQILHSFNYLCLLLLTLSMKLNSCLLNYDSWLKLNKNLQYIDYKLNNQNRKEQNFFRNFYVQFAVAMGGFFGINFYVCYICYKILPETVLSKTFCVSSLGYMNEFVVCVLVCNLAVAFKYRFQDINRNLCKIQVASLKSTKFDVVKAIHETGALWRTLSRSVVYFNRIFGWPIIIVTARLIGQVLQSLTLMHSIFTKNLILKNDTISQTMVFTNFFLVAYIFTCMILIVLCCDSASSTSKSTLSVCYKVQQNFSWDSKERQELILLAKEAADSTTKFTAADFFDINKRTFLGILSVTTTYFIIIIQYNTK